MMWQSHQNSALKRSGCASSPSWVTDSEVLAEIHELIDELERRARELGNGNGRDANTT
jgi:hypothetical protein